MTKRASLICSVLFAVLSLGPLPSHAQLDRWGVTAGLTSMTGQGEGLEDDLVGRNTGFLIGGTAQIGLLGPLSVRPELLFVRKGWTFTFRTANGGEATSTINLDYFEVPVLADVAVTSVRGATLHAVAGPTVGVMVNSGVSVDGDTQSTLDPSDTLSRTEVGFAVGGGASTPIGAQTVRVDVRYRLSLSNINEFQSVEEESRVDEPPTIRNRGLSVTVGIAF